jgi:hypothetical protein
MNGCRYCVIMHNRKRRGRQRARGVAMCLAREELTRCSKKLEERGPGCEHHDAKANATNSLPSRLEPIVAQRGRYAPRPELMASKAR